MEKQLTDDSFQVVLDKTTDITNTFEVNLGGIREDVCQATTEAIPYLNKLREEITKTPLPVGLESKDLMAGLIHMESWAQPALQIAKTALVEGRVAAADATPVVPHRRYLTTQIFACAVGILTSREPLNLTTRLAKTVASGIYDGSLRSVAELIQQADILTGSQSWPTAYMEYQLFDFARFVTADYVFIDGNLITQNLLTRRQGRNLFRRMLTGERKKYVGVIKDITRSQTELRMYGRALCTGEMYIQGTLLDCMSDRLQDYAGDTTVFLQTIGKDILRGVFKPGVKAFGFECHREDLAEIVALLWLDRDGQPGHEIPFLLNQVDAKLRGRYRPAELSSLIDAGLSANFDSELYFDEALERSFR